MRTDYQNFKLSSSTVHNLLKEFRNANYSGRRSLNKHASKLLQSELIKKRIQTYLADSTNPFWIEDLIKHVAKVNGAHLQYHLLNNYMKNNLNLSYKKGASRPWTLNLNRQKPLKELYAVQLIHMMKSRRDIIKIDESCLNNNTRVSYSWLSIGKTNI